jgi:predicted signal transduction protein with EAL and GGDEF domain
LGPIDQFCRLKVCDLAYQLVPGLLARSRHRETSEQQISSQRTKTEVSQRATDSVVRLGGDEFALLAANVSQPDEALA